MRLIDADALYETLCHLWDKSDSEDFEKGVFRIVINAPSIDIEPKQGEWIVYEGEWKDFDYYPPKCKCNQCGYEEDLYILNAKPTNFCLNCGARMTERSE